MVRLRLSTEEYVPYRMVSPLVSTSASPWGGDCSEWRVVGIGAAGALVSASRARGLVHDENSDEDERPGRRDPVTASLCSPLARGGPRPGGSIHLRLKTLPSVVGATLDPHARPAWAILGFVAINAG